MELPEDGHMPTLTPAVFSVNTLVLLFTGYLMVFAVSAKVFIA